MANAIQKGEVEIVIEKKQDRFAVGAKNQDYKGYQTKH